VAAKNFRAGSFSLRQVCWLGFSCFHMFWSSFGTVRQWLHYMLYSQLIWSGGSTY
jgi:hypothetical protein